MDKKLYIHLLEKIKEDNDGNHLDYVLPKFMSNIMTTYTNMDADLNFVKSSALELANNGHNHTVTSALWTSLITSYGKCFTDATHAKLPKLEVKDCFKVGNEEVRATHEKLMDLRHNFVAHRGVTDQEASIGYMRMNVDTLQRQLSVKSVKRIIPSTDDLESIVKLCDFLIPVVNEKYKVSAEKVASAQLKNFTPEEMEHMRIS